ncbi:unnamed protein product [Cylicocyclus nassatus]|uniref:Epoxide hydrolase n=1 Tax=Cylicocyclus nassatus TaxID=53992 RepID=A0AA36GK22_CYLNA|nr:unnamed protein product [Cylicocyclus nassatus]
MLFRFIALVSSIAVIPILFSIWLEYVPLHELPSIAKDGFWGPGEPYMDDGRIEVFKVDIPDEQIDDLKSHINPDRLVHPLEDCTKSQTRHDLMRNLSKVMSLFDWKQHQHFLNTFKQYRTEIEGLQIHFLRISLPKEKGKDTIPILLLHGFPGSYWDFYKVIPILTNPVRFGFDFGVKKPFQFEVIVPSLPGFLFSSKPSKKGLSSPDIARIAAKLMERLSIERYFVQGSELLGAEVATALAAIYPKQVRGVHLGNPLVHPGFSLQVSTKHILESFYSCNIYNSFFGRTGDFLDRFNIEVKNFEAIGDSLNSSPLSIASYLTSVWSLFSSHDPSRPLSQLFTLDELATISYFYYLTETTPHALRIMKTILNNDDESER